jgi:hypothetical protein
MTARMFLITNLTPGSDNLSRAYGKKYRLMTAGVVHVTKLTPGSGVQP